MSAALVSVLHVSGCASVDVLMLSGESFPPGTNHIEALEAYPKRPFIQLAELKLDSVWLSFASMRQKILDKAATLGADAVVFQAPKLLQPDNSDLATEQSDPAISSPPDNRFLENVQPSARYVPLGTDVKIILIHRGGHGGGHRGGRGHMGGHSGGPSGHRHSFHGGWGYIYAPCYTPRYWGYGMYGPGRCGYPPYRGSYGAYPWYDSPFNRVVIGTAIHYTDSH
jgi:hypothetical protein